MGRRFGLGKMRRALRDMPSDEIPDGGRTRRNIDVNRRFQIYERDKCLCVWCFESKTFDNLTLDHIVPWSEGGTERTYNLVTACEECNTKRGNKSIWEFAMETADGDVETAKAIINRVIKHWFPGRNSAAWDFALEVAAGDKVKAHKILKRFRKNRRI